MPRSSILTIGSAFLLLAFLGSPVSTRAQSPSDSLRRAALRDFHGPDLNGKDGPLAKAGLDLLLLYHEYRAFRAQGDTTFTPSQSELHVSEGHVTIDAIAVSDAQQLLSDLQALGLKEGAVAGRVVSGRFPILRIPALAKLESLRGVMPSRMRTKQKQDALPPTPPAPPEADTSARPDVPPSGDSPNENGEEGVLGFLLVTLLVLLLVEAEQ